MAVRTRQKKDGSVVYWSIYLGADHRQRLKKGRTVPPHGTEREHKLARTAAEKYALEQSANVANQEWRDPLGDKPFRELVAEFLKRYRPRSGRITYYKSRSQIWIRFLGEKPARSITAADVDKIREVRSREVKASTVRRDLISLGTVFRWGEAYGYVSGNPADSRRVKRPPEPENRTEYLSQGEETALLAACPEWIRPAVRWAINSGMDRSEVLALMTTDVDWKTGIVHATRSKTNVARKIPLDRNLVEILRAALRGRQLTAGCIEPVFLGPTGRPIVKCTAETTLQRAFREAKISKGQLWKLLRHTFGSRLAMAGAKLQEIQALMGHRSPNTTARYMHLSPDHLRDAMDKRAAWTEPERDLWRDLTETEAPEPTVAAATIEESSAVH